MASAGRYVVLLRGINVGGKNKLPMAELRALAESCGAAEASSYIQSGNLVFSASAPVAKAFPSKLSAAIEEAFAFKVPVVLRSEKQLLAVFENNPYQTAIDPKCVHVAFLAAVPKAADLKQLDPARSPPDEWTSRGGEIYLHAPGGLARTKLTNAYFDRVLKTTSTVRNWRTVTKLVELCSSR